MKTKMETSKKAHGDGNIYQTELPTVHYGRVGRKAKVDWREFEDAEDPDDEPLEKTPDYVIAVLGFDPQEDEHHHKHSSHHTPSRRVKERA